MPRIRTIKPEFWTDSAMVQLPVLARLLYIGMWNFADDAGALADDPDQIKLQVLPAEQADVHSLVDLLVACDRIARYQTEDGHRYLLIVHFTEHQKIDHPSTSRIVREGSRKLAIPLATRRIVATKYGCPPGEAMPAACYYCGEPGEIRWWRKTDGTPSSWVTFSHLELDHFIAEEHGGTGEPQNIVLSCRACNRSKGSLDGLQFVEPSRAFASPRENTRSLALEGKGKEKDKDKEGSLKEGESEGADAPAPAAPNKRFVPPTVDVIRAYMDTQDGEGHHAEEFYDHYQARKWYMGKTKMSDWEAAARGWIRRGHDFDAERIAAKRANGNHPPAEQTLDDMAQEELEALNRIHARREANL